MGSILDRGIKLDSGKKEVRTFARRLIKRSDDEDAVDTVAELLVLRLEQGHGELAGVELAAQVGDEFEEIAPQDAGLISSRIEKKFSDR